MKPDKKADDLLREKLNSYSSPVPAGLFDAMDKKREQQQTASAFGWRVKAGISAMVLLLGLGFVYWQTNSDSVSKTESTIINSENQTTVKELTEDKEDKQTQVIAQVQTELIEQQDLTSSINNTREEKIFIDKTQQQTKLSNSPTLLTTNLVKSTASKSDLIKQNSTIKTPTENNVSSFNSEKSDNIVKENPILPSDDILTNVVNEEEIAKKEVANQSLLVSPLESRGLLVDSKYHAAMPKIKCGWEARKVYLYFDGITSLGMAVRRLSPKLADDEAYAILRNQTESMQGSMNFGFRASAVTKGGFAMRTGLIYTIVKENFSQRITTYEERIITTTDAENNVLSIDTIFDPITQNFEHSNRHKLLDVPVIFGYEIDKEKYNVSFNAGAYINITASQEGYLLSPNSEIVDFSTHSPTRYDAFKTNVGMSLYSSFAVNCKITPAMHFIFEPYGHYYLNSFTNENHELNQKYFVGGIQVGLRMKM